MVLLNDIMTDVCLDGNMIYSINISRIINIKIPDIEDYVHCVKAISLMGYIKIILPHFMIKTSRFLYVITSWIFVPLGTLMDRQRCHIDHQQMIPSLGPHPSPNCTTRESSYH